MLSLRLVVVSAILMFAIACGGGYSSPVHCTVTVTDAVTHADAGRAVIVRRDSVSALRRSGTPPMPLTN